MKFTRLFRNTLKPIETEELPDLFLYRPLAFLMVLALRPLPVSPNAVTCTSMVMGICAGIHFARCSPVLGGLFALAANVLDCADGQLARLKGVSSKLGKALDGLADVITNISMLAGTAWGMIRSSHDPACTVIWALSALISLGLHILLFDHFKNELIFYSIPSYPDRLESLADLGRERRALGSTLKERIKKVLLSLHLAFYILEHGVIGLSQPAGYKGYLEWYKGKGGAPDAAKEWMKAHYRQGNRRLVRAWSLIGPTAHFTVFVVAGLTGRPDLTFRFMVLPMNIWMLLMIAAQRMVLSRQLKRAYACGDAKTGQAARRVS
ncbi:CDP-alcohol phosphatidyltransferase family protein [bacterium]|nr:CDP-alcohol phosphatidyltransferase family protein [bacterium]